MRNIAPRELVFDIETTNLNADIGVMLTFGWHWRGEKEKARAISIHDFPLFKIRPWDDSEIVREAHKIMSEADSLIYHYGDDFDLPFVKTRMLKIGKYFPRRHTVDTCKVAWRHLKLSARLANLAEFLGVTPKKNVPKEVWKKAGFGDIKSLEILRKRCVGDVVTLEEITERLTPYIKFINRNLFFDEKGCPNCGSKRIRRDGKKYFASTATMRQTYECQECNTCFQGEVINSIGPYKHA